MSDCANGGRNVYAVEPLMELVEAERERTAELERLASDILDRLDSVAWHMDTQERCKAALEAVQEYRQRLRSLGVEVE